MSRKIVHLVTTVFRLARPGGLRAVVAESVLVKHQLMILNRPRRRSPNLCIWDRLIAGLCTLWVRPRGFRRVAILFKPSTPVELSSRSGSTKISAAVFSKAADETGTQGPDGHLIRAVVDMKKRNPTLGMPPKLPSRSTWRSELVLIRMWFAGFWLSIGASGIERLEEEMVMKAAQVALFFDTGPQRLRKLKRN
jgi:hypothetical protein